MKWVAFWRKARIGIGILVCAVAGLLGLWMWNLRRVHKHCIQAAGQALRIYATDHEGRYPVHTNGFGDALALLVAGEYDSTGQTLVGVDDDASLLRSAATNKNDVPEELCTRIYVQGLSESDNPDIAILFDKFSVRGGDHRRGFGPYLREVLMGDGVMRIVGHDRWPAFASNQVELLVQAGIPRSTAEAYYRPTLDPNAKR